MQARNVAKTVGALLVAAAPLSYAGTDGTSPEVPNNELRLGVYYIHYFSSADDLSGPFTPPGLNVKLENLETLYAAYVRRLGPNFNLELAFGAPPLTKTEGKGPAYLGSVPYNGQVISTARWLAPTLLVNYMPLDESHALRPWVGVGVNWTTFYSRQSTAAGNAASGGPTSVSLPSSVGPAAAVGLSYQTSSRWSFHLSYGVSQIHSKLTADTAGIIRTSKIEFWPGALIASAGYQF
jgi:outer membrane protein